MSDGLFAELNALSTVDSAEREGRAWQLLAAAREASEFDVVLDWALENSLVPMELGAVIRGRSRGPQPSHSFINPTDGSQMIWIPPGRFLYGAKMSRELVDLPGFFLARHPITKRQFHRFIEATGYDGQASHPDPDRFLQDWRDGQPQDDLADHPVVWISMLDAWHYCQWAGLTLPTEQQWEKAARGPDGRHFPWGNTMGRKEGTAFWSPPTPPAQLGQKSTCAVGTWSETRTAYGCEDMVGNVSEWCWVTGSFPAYDPPDVPVRSTGELGTGREFGIVRGSAFMRSIWRQKFTTFHRRRLGAGRRNHWVGFRPALTLPR